MWGTGPPEALLPCPCSWTSASPCACSRPQASLHGADEEAAALRKVGCPGEGSNLPLTRSSAAQRISCYFWGPLRECRPPTCLTKPQSVALFTERQRQVLICRTETASMVFSRLPSVSMENVLASDMGVHSQEKREPFLFDLGLLTQHLWLESSGETSSCSPALWEL